MTASAALLCYGLTSCTATSPTGSGGRSTPSPTPTDLATPASSRTSSSTPSTTAPPTTTARPIPTGIPEPQFNTRAALRDIQRLADAIGPREATSDNFDEAANLVEERFADLGYRVDTERVTVPAGNSWGTPVQAGTSRNVLAEPNGFDDTEPHVVVVAHLDTIPVAPGAEDNASGVAVMLELARMVAATPPELPIRFIAFGAEEPRGPGDALHHFGSQQHVADLSRAERNAIEAVVALDRVGVRASYVPVCSARTSGNDLRSEIRDAADEVDVPTRSCDGNTTSDHWSYAKAGIPAVRLGSVPYAGYHSPDDLPGVIDRRQLDRVGRTMWAWLRSL